MKPPMQVERALLLAATVIALAACSGGPDAERTRRLEDSTRKHLSQIDAVERILADDQRVQRWRKEHERLARSKAAEIARNGAEREALIANTVNANAGLIAKLRELRRIASVAPVDTLPPGLVLIERTSGFGLRNEMGTTLTVSASLLLANGRGEPLEHCDMLVSRASAGRSYRGDVSPDAEIGFLADQSIYCNPDEGGLPREFAIWHGQELVWITDTLLHRVLGVPPDAVEEVFRRAAAQ